MEITASTAEEKGLSAYRVLAGLYRTATKCTVKPEQADMILSQETGNDTTKLCIANYMLRMLRIAEQKVRLEEKIAAGKSDRKNLEDRFSGLEKWRDTLLNGGPSIKYRNIPDSLLGMKTLAAKLEVPDAVLGQFLEMHSI